MDLHQHPTQIESCELPFDAKLNWFFAEKGIENRGSFTNPTFRAFRLISFRSENKTADFKNDLFQKYTAVC